MKWAARCLLCVIQVLMFSSYANAGHPGEPLKNKYGEDIFVAAIREGRLDVVIHLLKEGGDPNQFFHSKLRPGAAFTGLYLACSIGKLEIVEALVEYGVDINLGLIYSDGKTVPPVMKAVLVRHADILKVLVSHPNIRLNDISTALHPKPQFDPTAFEKKRAIDNTPLSMAACHGRKDIVEILLAAGADYSVKINGRTSQQIASKTLEILEEERGSLQGQEQPDEQLKSVLDKIERVSSVCELLGSWASYREGRDEGEYEVPSTASVTKMAKETVPPSLAHIKEINLALSEMFWLGKHKIRRSTIEEDFGSLSINNFADPALGIHRVYSYPVKK